MELTISFGRSDNDFTGGESTAKIWYMKPDKSTGNWTATISADKHNVFYKTSSTDIDQVGPWDFQAVVDISGDIWKSEIKQRRFYKSLNS